MTPRRVAAITLSVLAGGLLVAALALSAFRGEDRELGAGVSADIATTQNVAAEHARAMRQQAESLIAAAERSAEPEREHWLADGRTMLAYAARLEALAATLADRSKLLAGHSTWRTQPGLGLLEAVGRALRDEGRSIAAHADTMSEHARAMEPTAEAAGLSAQDIALLRDGAGRMRDAATRTVRLGEALERYGDGLRRGLAMR